MTQSEYNRCVKEHADGLFRFVLKNYNYREKAEDIVQQAFEVLWTKCSEVENEKAKSFLFTVAYRKMIDEMRKDKRLLLKDEMPIALVGTTEIKQIDLRKRLHAALEELPAIQKQLVLLKDYEGYSYDEMAGITGISESQVKVYLFRARMSLKKSLVSIEANI